MRQSWQNSSSAVSGDALVGAGDAPFFSDDRRDPSALAKRRDMELGGVMFGIGALVGVVIGANVTFHSPVRRRH